jgi:hypothetical protein
LRTADLFSQLHLPLLHAGRDAPQCNLTLNFGRIRFFAAPRPASADLAGAGLLSDSVMYKKNNFSNRILPKFRIKPCCHDSEGARKMTAKDELKALAAECLEKNNMNAYLAMEEFKVIVSKRPDLLEVVERQFEHVLLVNPSLLSINDPPDKLPQA